MSVQIWAHRGASGYEPENTLESFSKAVDMKADGVELDVQLTSDGELVVIHDERVDRVSDGTGYVRDMSFRSIRALDVSKPVSGYGKTVRVPALREVFELLKDTGLMINVEIKNGIFPYSGIEEKVVSLIDEMGMEKKIWISSFNHEAVLRVKNMNPALKCAFLFGDVMIDPYEYGRIHKVNALHPAIYHFLHDEHYIERAHEKGLEVHAWTVNEKEHLSKLMLAGIDAVISNYPDRAFEVRRELATAGRLP